MARLVDAREGQVAVLADLAAGVGGVGLDAGVAGAGEGVGGGVRDGERDEFAAVPGREELVCVLSGWRGVWCLERWDLPVARVVSVAVHESDFDPVVEQIG